jgi:hypothetical protein
MIKAYYGAMIKVVTIDLQSLRLQEKILCWAVEIGRGFPVTNAYLIQRLPDFPGYPWLRGRQVREMKLSEREELKSA